MALGTLEAKAKAFATQRHEGQFRKYTMEPYITHPAAVADIVRSVPHSEEMLAAAWLHDVVEDTETTIAEINNQFGERVADYVWFLTDIAGPECGNRARRKRFDRFHLSCAPNAAKTVKLADTIHNMGSITLHDPKFAEVYLEEKALLLPYLYGGDFGLWQEAIEATRRGGRNV